MSKIDPFDLPKEFKKSVIVVLRNIQWDTSGNTTGGKLPVNMRIPLESETPRSLLVPAAMDVASNVWGFSILDCDVDPLDLDDTLEYEGEIF